MSQFETYSNKFTHAVHDNYSSPALYIVSFISCIVMYAFATRSMAATGVALISSAAMIAIYMPSLFTVSQNEKYATFIFIGLLTLVLPIAAWREPSAIYHYIVTSVALGSALASTRNPTIFMKATYYTLVALQIAIATYLLTTGIYGFPLERMIPNSSSNGITSYLIVLQTTYCIAHYVMHRKTVIFMPILTLLICIVGYGRSSILVAVLIIIVNLLFRINARKIYHSIFTFLAVVIVFSTIWARYGDLLTLFVISNTKFGGTLSDAHRSLMIREYFTNINLSEVIFGRSYLGLNIAQIYNSNPHNSYIRGHHTFGIFYLLGIIAYLYFVFRNFYDSLVVVYAIFMLAMLLLRAFTEPILFPTMLDYFFFGSAYMIARGGHVNANGAAHA